MQTILFTLLAIVLYLAADRLLQALEARAGRRFEYRSLIFFGILLVMAVAAFGLVRQLAPHA